MRSARKPWWQQATALVTVSDWRRDNRAQLRPRGGHDDDLADQRATPPARPGAGGAARHVHRPGGRRGQRGRRDERRAAAGGDRQRGRVLPAARQDQDARPDGGADLGQHQHQRRRPRPVVRRVRQPHARARRAGGRPAELGHRRRELPVAAARMGRRAGGHQPGLAADHVPGRGRAGARPVARARRRVPAAAGRLGGVRRPRRGGDQLRRRGARHDRRRLAARPHGQRALVRRATRRAGGRGVRRQRQPQAGRRRRRVNGAGGAPGRVAGRHGEAAPGKAGTGKAAPAATPAPSAATAEVPGIPAPNPSAGSAAAAGRGATGGTAPAPEKAAAAPKIAKGTGTAAGAAVPGVLASGDLLGGTATGHVRPAAAGGSDATVPGLPASSAGAGSVAIPGAMPTASASASPRAHPAAAPSSTPATAHPGTSPTTRATNAGAPASPGGQHYSTPGTKSQQAFISLVAPGAIAAQQRYGVPGRGDDRAGHRGVRLGAERPGRAVPQPVRHQGNGPGGQRDACRPPSTRAGSG